MIVILVCWFQFLGRELLQYDLVALQKGEIYRAYTGHFVHLSLFHLFGNIIAMGVTFFWLSFFCGVTWVATMLILGPLAISFLFLVFMPQLNWYVGLSGTIYALIFFGLLNDKKLNLEPKILLAALLMIRIYLQMAAPNEVSSYSELLGGKVIPESHAFGAIIGAFLGLFKYLVQHAR